MSQFIKTDDSKIAQTSRGGGGIDRAPSITEKRFNEEVKYGDKK